MINNEKLDEEIREILTETIPELCEFFYDNIPLSNTRELMQAEGKLIILSKTIKNMMSTLCGKVRFHENETIGKIASRFCDKLKLRELEEFEENKKQKCEHDFK